MFCTFTVGRCCCTTLLFAGCPVPVVVAVVPVITALRRCSSPFVVAFVRTHRYHVGYVPYTPRVVTYPVYLPPPHTLPLHTVAFISTCDRSPYLHHPPTFVLCRRCPRPSTTLFVPHICSHLPCPPFVVGALPCPLRCRLIPPVGTLTLTHYGLVGFPGYLFLRRLAFNGSGGL